MNLQARKIRGDINTAEDGLEIKLDTSETLATCVYRVILVSGVGVTHGGGASADTYLNYLSADDEDWSLLRMHILQEGEGTSVIKIEASINTQATDDAYVEEYQNWVNNPDEEAKGPEPVYPDPIILETGEITLEYAEDSFV